MLILFEDVLILYITVLINSYYLIWYSFQLYLSLKVIDTSDQASSEKLLKSG